MHFCLNIKAKVTSTIMNNEVLIIEDDIINQLILKKMLSRRQVIAHEAENGAIGLDVLKAQKNISHVVLDLNLPVMDGYAFIEHLNRDESYNHLKIYILSCNPKTTFNAKVQKRNIDIKQVVRYYEKPLVVETLIDEILADK